MSFSDHIKAMIDETLKASKDLADKAGAKAQSLGEQGLLVIEIKKLETKVISLISSLGEEVYKDLIEERMDGINAETPGVKKILDDITEARNSIEKKEAELKKL